MSITGTDKSDIVVAIVGAGLGGICAAIALGRAGYNVHVFEKTPSFGQVGVGISIGPNAVRALDAMGILEEYISVADMTEENAVWFNFRKWDTNEKFAVVHASGRRSNVHRARALEAFTKILPCNVVMHFCAAVTEVENVQEPGSLHSSGVRLRYHMRPQAQATTMGDHTFDCAFAIICDGVNSVLRRQLGLQGGEKGAPGRAIEVNGLEAAEQTMWIAKDKHIITYSINGGDMINLVAFVSDRSQNPDDREWSGPWVRPATQDVMLADFHGWSEQTLNVLKLVEKPEQCALHELTPLSRWTVDRITLLGDAAHASLPHNGAGAGQAIEDAYVLSKLLSLPQCTSGNIASFLNAYEAVRRPRASRQQDHSRETGDIYEFSSKFGDDYQAIAKHFETRFQWIWEHDLSQDVEAAKAMLLVDGVL